MVEGIVLAFAIGTFTVAVSLLFVSLKIRQTTQASTEELNAIKLKHGQIAEGIAALQEEISSQSTRAYALEGNLEMKFLKLSALLNTQNPTLQPEDAKWILRDGGVEKLFEPGTLSSVTNSEDNTELKYEHKESGEVVCSHWQDGILKACTEFSKYGAPLRGTVYDKDGNKVSEYEYDKLGQVSKIERG